MRYKRSLLISVAIGLLMLVSAACVKSDNTNTTDTTNASQNSEKESNKENKKETKKREKSKNSEDKEEVKQVSEVPHIILEKTSQIYVDKNSDHYLYISEISHLCLKNDSEEFKPLAKALDKYNEEADANIAKAREEMAACCEDLKKDSPSYFYNHPMLSDETDVYVIRSDKNIVSILDYRVADYGGVHPGYQYSSHNYDTNTGEEIKFTDVVKDTSAFFGLADNKIKENYPDDNLTMPSEYVKDMQDSNYKDLVWTVNAEGVSVYFNTYTLGAYASGVQIITVYFDQAKDMFNDKYVNKEKDYVFPLLTEDMVIDLDINNEGKREPVRVKNLKEKVYEDNDIYFTGMEVFAGDKKSVRIYGYDGSTYVIKKDGKYYLYLFSEQEGDYEALSVVDLSTMNYNMTDDTFYISPASITTYWSEDGNTYTWLEETFTDTQSFQASISAQLLSTFFAAKEWYVGKNGRPESNEDRYKVTSNHVLHTLKDVKCEEVDEKGNVKKSAVIPENSYLLFLYSDGENWVDVRIIDENDVNITKTDNGDGSFDKYFSVKNISLKDYKGPLYRITINKDEEYYKTKVGGVDINQLFEGIVFAG